MAAATEATNASKLRARIGCARLLLEQCGAEVSEQVSEQQMRAVKAVLKSLPIEVCKGAVELEASFLQAVSEWNWHAPPS